MPNYAAIEISQQRPSRRSNDYSGMRAKKWFRPSKGPGLLAAYRNSRIDANYVTHVLGPDRDPGYVPPVVTDANGRFVDADQTPHESTDNVRQSSFFAADAVL